MLKELIVLTLFCFGFGNSYNPDTKRGHVLFYFPIIPKSGKMTFMPVAEELAARGHRVTVVTPYATEPLIRGNLREIFSTDMDKFAKTFEEDAWSPEFQTKDWKYFKRILDFFGHQITVANETLSNSGIRAIWDGIPEKVDTVITAPMTGNEISYYLAYRHKASTVIWSAQQNPMSIYDNAIGQPHNTAYIGNFFSTYRHPMTFSERIGNTIGVMVANSLRDWFTLDQLDKVVGFHFPDDKNRPSIRELEKDVGLLLQFSHPLIMDGVRPTNPNFVSVGMMNCRPAKPLPDKLKKFMDESGDDGVILVSFGSVLKASKMPEDMRKLFLNVFSRLKQRVLWKWETETMEDMPPNLMLSKWLPQQDILGHEKLRLFVSHGGQSSCQESLCHQKPMVIMPVFGDQPANAKEAEIKGYGIHLSLQNLTEEAFYNTIKTVLDEPKYSLRAKEHGSLLLDDITKPLERAVWWIEYSMRYPGVRHLRSPTHDMPWYQHSLLDVYAFLTGIFLAVIVITYKLLKCLVRLCCKAKPKQD